MSPCCSGMALAGFVLHHIRRLRRMRSLILTVSQSDISAERTSRLTPSSTAGEARAPHWRRQRQFAKRSDVSGWSRIGYAPPYLGLERGWSTRYRDAEHSYRALEREHGYCAAWQWKM